MYGSCQHVHIHVHVHVQCMSTCTCTCTCYGYEIFPFQNQRVPADLILLRTTEKSGTCFVRTDQLDGETDWKLRVATPTCQALASNEVGHVISRYSHVITIDACCRSCLVLMAQCLQNPLRKTSTALWGS